MKSTAVAFAILVTPLAILPASGCSSSTTSDSAPVAQKHDALKHCVEGHQPDPRDEIMANEPTVIDLPTLGAGVKDLAIPNEALDWLDEQGWPQQHADWHNIRRWDSGCRKLDASPYACASAKRMADRGLWRASKQESAPGDGYGFLVMHRHMIQSIKRAFPKHEHLFAGFKHIPLTADDPENTMPWRSLSWTAQWKTAIDKLDHIEDHLAEFPTEDDLGTYIQATSRWNAQGPSDTTGIPTDSGIHNGALHIAWSVEQSPVQLTHAVKTIYNYSFWKLHGWIDDVWERYRVAKGIASDDPALKEELYNQCKEMVELDKSNLLAVDTDAGVAAPSETGFFATQVRPVLDAHCSGCHGDVGANAGLTLSAKAVGKAEIISGLVNVKSTETAMNLVTPGDPTNSFLYRKVTGDFDGITCSNCKTQMPQVGLKLSTTEADLIKQWIADGAKVD
jgi:hypothetical protein